MVITKPKSKCKCGKPSRSPNQRYCKVHHAAYVKRWRLSHPLTGEAQKRSNLRSYTRVLLKRGHLRREPCWCGKRAQIVHLNWKDPRAIAWVCRSHRLAKNLGEGRKWPQRTRS